MMLIKRKIDLILEKPYDMASVSEVVQSKNTPLKMVTGATYFPKYKLGEDSLFICAEQQTFGIADGVGGWAKKGIDAGEYARELMRNAAILVQKKAKLEEVSPLTVLTQAYSNTKAQGSSTACIISLKDNHLHAVNVGDSGFLVFRKGELVYESPVQHHRFNCPYQLGSLETSDSPSSAAELKVKVEVGDIIVAGTDGLLDNMFATKIKEVVAQGAKDGVEPQQSAYTIACYALHNSFDRVTETPFSRNAKLAKREHIGGKKDDITVIVSHIVQV